jgi:hypothetical protein
METAKSGGMHLWYRLYYSLYRFRMGYSLYIQENRDLVESIKSCRLQWRINGMLSVETVVRYADCLVLT